MAKLPKVDEKMRQAVIAMSEPTRLEILMLLGQSGGLCVNDIASRFSITRPAVSHHLRILKDNELVISSREGQEVIYSTNHGHLVGILRAWADVIEACCKGE